ncbi:response regulator [Candidatus Pantoea multigeneris]|uniref:Transporter substrate-binding domain-containing protein n=1 Tax=Candidatus Pantoea multigeneris TaxID=2608357 RepID=A0ABX0RGD0_9GAMM|nr:response regulator [Pantoea multigeneris]NIF23758.1 transporter substrate-binding domain-containing protein [Pantoea multigeneris]
MRRLLLCLMILLFIPGSLSAITAQPLVVTPRISLVELSVAKSEKNKAWLQQQKSLQIGVWGEVHPPFSILASNGIYQGVIADVIGLMQKSIDLPIQVYGYPDAATALSALEKGEIMMLPVWQPENASTDTALLTRPWLHDRWTLLARHNDRHLIKTTGIVEGNEVSRQSKASWPSGVAVRYMKSYSAALNDLSFGQLDAVWITKISADYLLSTASLPPLPLFTAATQPATLHFSVNRQHPELLELIDDVLSAMPLTHKTQLAQGWGIPLEALIDEKAPADVLQQNITVIVDTRQRPLTFENKEKQISGLLIDLLALIKRKFNIDYQLMPAHDDAELAVLIQRFPEALPPAKWVMPEETTGRSLVPDIHWLTSQSVVLFRNTTQQPQNFSQLPGERIAILRDDPILNWLETHHPTVRLVFADSIPQAMSWLKNNRIRGMLMPLIQANYLLSEPEYSDVKMGIALPASDLVFASPLSESSISGHKLKVALATITPAEINHLIAKWRVPASTSSAPPAASESLSLGWIILAAALVAGLLGAITQHLRRKKASLSITAANTPQMAVHPSTSQRVFLQHMHHEMGNHLHALRGLLDLELHKKPLSAESHENLSTMQETAAQLTFLATAQHDFIALADTDLPGKIRPIVLAQLGETIVTWANSRALAQNITLNFQYRLSRDEYHLNVLAVTRILLSLVLNAIKHSKGTRVTLFVAESPPSGLLFEVADNGTFADKAESARASSLWGETGLNVEECKRLAKGIAGTVSCETPAGQGTIVSLLIPIAPVAECIPPPVPTRVPVTILVVDDHAPSRRLLETLLQQQGCQVLSAQDGAEGLKVWLENRSVIHGIVTDLAMPNMDGYALARKIRQAEMDSSLIITALSASDDFATVEMSLQAGMNDCLSKPLNAAALRVWLQCHFQSPHQNTSAIPSTLISEHYQEWQEINHADMAALRQACEQEDRKEIARLAHRLISTAHLAKNDDLKKYCKMLEKDAFQFNMSEIKNMINKIDPLIAELTSANQKEG